MSKFSDFKGLPDLTYLDFETTGLKDPAAVSLAIIRQENFQNVYAKYFLINPEKQIEYSAYKVHGISFKDVENSPTFPEVWKEISKYIQGKIIVGHNVKFDSGVITGQLARYNIPCQEYYTICTCQNAKRLIEKNKIPNYKLDSLCSYFDISLTNHHDARDDTDACRKILKHLGELGQIEIQVAK